MSGDLRAALLRGDGGDGDGDGDEDDNALESAAARINGPSSVTGEVGYGGGGGGDGGSFHGSAAAASASADSAASAAAEALSAFNAMTADERRQRLARLIRIESAAATPRPGQSVASRAELEERRRRRRAAESRGASAVQATVNVVQVFMGIGMLSMPYAMRLSGWSGIAALAGALALFNASAHLLVGGLEMLPAGVPRSYPSLGAAAFGPAGRRLVGLLALSEFGGGAIVTFAIVFRQIIILRPGSALNLVAPLSFLATVPMLAVPSFRSLTPLSALGCFSGLAVGAAVLACVIADPRREHYGGLGGGRGATATTTESSSSSSSSSLLLLSSSSSHHHHSGPSAASSPPPHHAIGWGILRAIGIFAVSVSGHSSLPALRASMAKPEEFHDVLDAAFAVMGLLYGGIAAAGYYYFGDASKQVVTANLKEDAPFSGGALFNVRGLTLDNAIGGFVLLNAFTTYPALIMIVQDMLWALFSPAWARRRTGGGGAIEGGGAGGAGPPAPPVPPMRPLPRLMLRLAAATLTAAVAVGAYSSVADCLALVGGASSMSCSLLLPAACYLKLAGGGSGGAGSSSPSSSSSPAGEPEEGGRQKKMTAAARRALIAMLVGGSALTAAVVGQSLSELINGGKEEGGVGGRSLVAAVLFGEEGKGS